MKVVIATGHGPEYADLAAITKPLVDKYCEKHGYDFHYDPERNDKDACKIAMYQEAYATGRYGPDDVWCWADTDLLIMNSNRRIEDIVYEHMPRNIHYLIGVDVNGLNSGFYMVRFTPEALLFVTVANSTSISSGWADQEGLIQTALKSPHKEIYKEVPGRVFNCNLYDLKGWEHLGEYGNYVNRYEPGCLALHPAGVEEPTRTAVLQHYAKLAV